MDFTIELDEKQFEDIENILTSELIDLGVSCVLLIDLAGNILINLDNGKVQHDVYSLAALAAGNFGAVSEMARIIGEDDFSLLFHKGQNESIHFSRITQDLLLLTIFGSNVSLGFLRLRVAEAIEKIQKIL